MWKVLLTLVLASYSLAAPQEQPNSNLNATILNVSGPPPDTQPPIGREHSDDLDSTILNLLTQQQSSTSSISLETQKQPQPQPEDCECVPYYLCRNGTIVIDGVGLIDLRDEFTQQLIVGCAYLSELWVCTNYLDRCCKLPDQLKPGEQIMPPPTERKGCGQRHPDGVGFRITGHDNEAQFGEFPWMVVILKERIGDGKQKQFKYQCGGSLIHKQAVLTAAHCVVGIQPQEITIRAGEWDTQTMSEIFPHQDRNVQKVIVHESYHSGSLYHDVALLILNEPVELAENVDIVCLPAYKTVYNGSRCFASGWGKDKYGKEGYYSIILKKIELPIVPHDTCQSNLRETVLGKYFRLHESFICAGGESGKDTCKGDGGSPLMCPSTSDPTRYEQMGIVAWGIECGNSTVPGVYANVAYLRNWIDDQMVDNKLDNTVYNI
ncbi:Serine proteinase stubble [Dufourea novaeangliae]|uniref:Phenoloxidase-activating factor 2 n=1 Tax=Dufourea novaeangliae TaxID=178035 RepID=A0A154PTA6_DUFNO|nr:Serine proteinase stubble [Dufourea novaeangliae]